MEDSDNKKLFALRDSWYQEAKEQTSETLQQFIDKLIKYDHDYNTICYACGAASIAAATAIDKSPSGGITGFQAGAIMWEFISNWMGYKDEPIKLLKYDKMLYPQYENHFHSISKDTWKWLQEQAKKNLANKTDACEAVIEHWESIAMGIIPFNYYVED